MSPALKLPGAVAFAAAFGAGNALTANVHAPSPVFLRGAGDAGADLVKPLSFKQQLCVCNAYPSSSPMAVQKNSKDTVVGGDDALPFRQCRYLQGQVLKNDQLDFGLRDVDLHGTFEVSDLPASDAVLLLVVQRREGSPTMAFQSFAFPAAAGHKEAQIAVINTFAGNATSPKLKIEDHISTGESQTVSKRVEQLIFNRVYSVNEGDYEASVTDFHRSNDTQTNTFLENSTKTVLSLARSTNYVVLRTGGEGFEESLVVFPNAVQQPSARLRVTSFFRAVLPTFMSRAFGVV